jgi:hypothetical protein
MVDDLLQGVALEGDLVEDAQGNLWGEAFVIFLAGRDDESRHVECTWRDDELFAAFFEIAVRTVLGAWEDHGEEVIVASPADDIQHRFRLYGR